MQKGITDPCCKEGRIHGISDRKSTRLNSSHLVISYAVFCLKKEELEIALIGGQRVIGRGEASQAHSPLEPSPDTAVSSAARNEVHCTAPSPVILFFLMIRAPPRSTLFPYTPFFR